jgi:restriction endonuclease S subunit
MSQVASLQVPIPPSSVQQKFAQIVQHFDHAYENQKRSNGMIDDLFHTLMQKVFKGELPSGQLQLGQT